MQFTKCVINASYTPTGFLYEDNGYERYEDFSSLCRRNASDGRLTFSGSGVFGLHKYDENDIEICRETEGGGYSDPVDPGITLMVRILSGGKVVGYVVKDGTGVEVKKRVDSILSASKYLKPRNFRVMERDGRRYLQGHAGTSLSNLPSIDLTPALTTSVNPRTVQTEPYDVVDPKLAGGISLVHLFEVVDSCGGCMLKMPEDDYKPVGEVHVEDAIGFTRIKRACEIAPSVLNPSSKKLSASLKYKVPGAVLLSDGSAAIAYLYRDKNLINIHYEDGILRGDKVRLERIGIAVPKVNAPKLYQALAGTVAVGPMTNAVAAESAIKLVQMDEPELLEVSVAELPMLGSRYTDYLLAGVHIKEILDTQSKYKYASDFLKVLIKGLKSAGTALKGEVWKHYANLSSSVLSELSQYVDIYTGIYTETSSCRNHTNSGAVAKDANVEIVYGLEMDSLHAPKDFTVVSGMSITDVPSGVQELLAPILVKENAGRQLQLAENYKKEYDHVLKKYEMQLFRHKVAMILDGNNTVHGHDNFEWTPAAVSARAQFTKYTHTSGVYVTLRQVAMKH